MINPIRHCVLGLIAVGAIAAGLPAMAAIDVDVSASRDAVYLGESLIMTVKVSGADPIPEPDVSAIRDADINLVGNRYESRWSAITVNGKRTRTGFSGRIFEYSVTPRSTGSITLGPIEVRQGNQSATANGPRIKVTGVEDQDAVIIKVTTSRDTVLVDETFEVTMDLFIMCLPEPNTDVERILGGQPPALSIPYLTTSPIEGLEYTDTITFLQSMITSRPNTSCFGINGFNVRNSPFDFENMPMFNEVNRSSPARFILPSDKSTLNGQSFWRYRIHTQYIAREERTHTFGPVAFKGSILDGVDSSGRAVMGSIFAIGPSQTVRVIPPPEQGRPDTFIGAIGTNMLVDAKLDTQNCRIGDPLALTITVSGGVNLRNIYPPDLSKQEELLKTFRVYDDTLSVQRGENSISFTYTIRPMSAGSLELPPIDLAYFDSASRNYRMAHTAPIPVTASDAGGLETGMILGTQTNMLDGASSPQHRSINYIAPFVPHPSASRNRHIGLSFAHVLFIAGAPLLFLLSLAARPASRLKNSLSVRSGKRDTCRKALSLLKKAETMEASEASIAIASAIRDYSGSYFGVRAASLTPSDLAALINRSGLDSEAATDLIRIVHRSFNSSFANKSDAVHPAKDARRAREVIKQLEQLTPQRAKSPLPTIILLVLMASAASADTINNEADFLWQKAWSRTVSARSEADFKAAAKAYGELVASGVRNEYVFYNMGTALLLGGDSDGALSALERAERYGGADSRMLQNIQAAVSNGDPTGASLPWARVIFFWHYLLPFTLRTTLAVTAWVILFLLPAVSRLRNRRVDRLSMILASLALIMFGSSAFTSAIQEHQSRVRDSYIIQSDNAGGIEP